MQSAAEAGKDALFDPIAAGLVKVDPDRARRAAEAQMHGSPQAMLDAHRQAFAALDAMLTGGAPRGAARVRRHLGRRADGKRPRCRLGRTVRHRIDTQREPAARVRERMEGQQLGWGRLTVDRLREVLAIHAVYADVARRNPYIAQARGSNLLAHIVASLEQAAGERPATAALGRPGDAMLFLSDTTPTSRTSRDARSVVAVPGYVPDDTPPGGALIVSLWRDTGSGELRVRARTPRRRWNRCEAPPC